MKRILMLVAILLLSVLVFAGYQPDNLKDQDNYSGWAKKRTIVTLNIPSLLSWGLFELHCETSTGSNMGIALNLGGEYKYINQYNNYWLSAGLEYNFYFQNHALNGLYAGPIMDIIYSTVNYMPNSQLTISGDTKIKYTFYIMPGIHAGYRWIWEPGLLFDLSLGYGYFFGKPDITKIINGLNSLFSINPTPLIGCDIGYSW